MLPAGTPGSFHSVFLLSHPCPCHALRRNMNLLLRFLLAAVLLPAPAVYAADCKHNIHEQQPVVEYDHDRRLLSVVAEQQYLSEVLASVTNATGIEFVNDAGSNCEKVSVDFDFLPLESALKILLRDRSYVVRQHSSKDTLSVWLLPPGNGERMTDTDVDKEIFYDDLENALQTQELAKQLKRMEQQEQR